MLATCKGNIYVGMLLNGILAKFKMSPDPQAHFTEILQSVSATMPSIKEFLFSLEIQNDTIYNTPNLLYSNILASTALTLSVSEISNTVQLN